MPYAEITPASLQARLHGGEELVVLDVREHEEVAEWAFPGAVHIPLGELGTRAAELPNDRTIVVVCHAGVRSAVAADALCSAGWTAESLAGGTMAWLAHQGGG